MAYVPYFSGLRCYIFTKALFLYLLIHFWNTRGKGTFIIEKMEDHFLALQTYGYHDNAVPSEVLLTTLWSLYLPTYFLSCELYRRWTLTLPPSLWRYLPKDESYEHAVKSLMTAYVFLCTGASTAEHFPCEDCLVFFLSYELPPPLLPHYR